MGINVSMFSDKEQELDELIPRGNEAPCGVLAQLVTYKTKVVDA